MTTEAAFIVIGAAVLLITLLTYLAGRREHRVTAVESPGAATAPPASAAAERDERSLLSERDAVLGDEDRDESGRFARAGDANRTL